jgi:formate hydrogenlyase subunit 3/multisubunit Na+/H+ antiporter MnhD subunit
MMALSFLLPLTGGLVVFGLGRRAAQPVAVLSALGTLFSVLVLAGQVAREGPQGYALGGWPAPLGIELYADGVAVFMLLVSAVVGVAVSLYALGYFPHRPSESWLEEDSFWPLWLMLWAAMNALYLSADLFNLYVTLELVTLAAVGLVILSGKEVSLTAGMRYLLAALAGSLFYLFGLSLVYAAFGTLHLTGLAPLLAPGAVSWLALALMTAGLMVKTALWPFHFWLPPAHASAPAPVSALLSALVVKVSFYLILRLWLDVFAGVLNPAAAQVLGALGATAILWGSFQAIRQTRLKLLVAYSTVAQLGYLFLLFPLGAFSAGLHHALAHALAKAAMFMVAGAVIHACGSDELEDIGGAARRLPLATLTFALAGFTLLGLPPSAGYHSKELFLAAVHASGQWWWEAALRLGALLAAVYLALALRPLLERAGEGANFRRVPWPMTWAPLLLALLAALFGLLPQGTLSGLLEVGR